MIKPTYTNTESTPALESLMRMVRFLMNIIANKGMKAISVRY